MVRVQLFTGLRTERELALIKEISGAADTVVPEEVGREHLQIVGIALDTC